MSTELVIRAVISLAWLAVGLSHALQPRMWIGFFVALRAMGRSGNTINATLTLVPGVLIVLFHNVWHGLPMLMTIVGWLYLIKSALYLAFPKIGLGSIGRVDSSSKRKLVVAGAVLIALSLLMGWTIVDELQGSM